MEVFTVALLEGVLIVNTGEVVSNVILATVSVPVLLVVSVPVSSIVYIAPFTNVKGSVIVLTAPDCNSVTSLWPRV